MSATTTIAPAAEPAVGLHLDVPAEVYHSWPGASNSRLSLLLRSPAHLWAELSAPPKPETPAQVLGAAIHYAALEPDLFTSKYAVAEQCSASTKAGSRCSKGGSVRRDGHWFCGQHDPGGFADGTITLSPDDYATCLKVRDSVWRHPAAKVALSGEGMNEASMVWDDPETGVRCKARADRISLELGAIIDLKTTRDAREQSFSRDIFNYGYHRQAAFYTAAASLLLERQIGLHYIVAVEKEAPCAVAVYRLRDDAIEAGRQQLEALLRRYAECVEADHWPAYGDEPVEISLPTWAWGQLDEQTERTVGA